MNNSGLNYKELIKLQEQLREGILDENDITDEVYIDLKELYLKQINKIKELIKNNKQEIEEIRKKMRMLNPHFI